MSVFSIVYVFDVDGSESDIDNISTQVTYAEDEADAVEPLSSRSIDCEVDATELFVRFGDKKDDPSDEFAESDVFGIRNFGVEVA